MLCFSSFAPLPGLSVVFLVTISTLYLEIGESVGLQSLLYVTKTFSRYIIYHTFILTAYFMSNVCPLQMLCQSKFCQTYSCQKPFFVLNKKWLFKACLCFNHLYGYFNNGAQINLPHILNYLLCLTLINQ